MIEYEQQYQITKRWRQNFSYALNNLELMHTDNDLLKQMQVAGLKSQIEDFNAQLNEYEMLKKGSII